MAFSDPNKGCHMAAIAPNKGCHMRKHGCQTWGIPSCTLGTAGANHTQNTILMWCADAATNTTCALVSFAANVLPDSMWLACGRSCGAAAVTAGVPVCRIKLEETAQACPDPALLLLTISYSVIRDCSCTMWLVQVYHCPVHCLHNASCQGPVSSSLLPATRPPA
jgi:hypothetical protein